MHTLKSLLALVITLLLLAGPAVAERVTVLALFPGKAMLQIDDKRKILADGERYSDGLVLLKASPQQALVLLNGREEVLTLGNSVSANYARPVRQAVRLLKQKNSFFIDGLINGQPMRMLVDTGATHVAISEQDARRLGIPYITEGTASQVRTASGVKAAHVVRLKSLKVAGKNFQRVRAMVVEGDSPRNVLLGMNILGQFDIEQSGNLMILRNQ